MAFHQAAGATRHFTRKHFPVLTKLVGRKRFSVKLHGSSNPNLVSPIHLLPPEILIRIFDLVCHIHSYYFCPAAIHPDRLSKTSRPFLKQPVTLSHVCSRWRRITIDLASLWSHIDLFPDQCYDLMLSARLETYVARSAQALLDIHIILRSSNSKDLLALSDNQVDDNACTIFPFLTTAAPRVRSLSIMARSSTPLGDKFCASVLATCFAHCIPGTITDVSIEAPGPLDYDWIPSMQPYLREGRLAKSTIETLWAPITVLHLSQCDIPWSSKAYHGLTELRLHDCPSLNSSRLMSILQSSPQLRVLELDSFRRPISENPLWEPVPLNNLEVLVLVGVQDCCLGSVLRLIAPGPKPLSLSISNPLDYYTGFASKTELQSFISRSNITQLCVNKVQKYAQLVEICDLIPTVHTLAVDSFSCEDTAEDDSPPPSFTLDALYIVRSRGLSSHAWAVIESLVNRYQLQKLVLWWCDFRALELDVPGGDMVPGNLYTICPVVKVAPDDEPNPIDGWYFQGLHNYFS
ncbi:unnamed protein product [Rhizoctonia solani]|uniref:F-box domain-containing protein n=1 Tax=Rhizoctonia solani TaxID=456999 RepID=A0A8H3BY57_9AGAM|nr:unnamed protein product [Rhizoctonia solani]